MRTIDLRISDLRKNKGLTQQDLAGAIGVTFQTVSKWENGVTMPDITMLPLLAEYFRISVDELLGLRSLPGEEYILTETGKKNYWDSKKEYLIKSRQLFWNMDYMKFLLNEVFLIKEPVNILDCGCGYGALGLLLLPLLPKGSSYTGLDFNEQLLQEGKATFENEGLKGGFWEGDVYDVEVRKQYDIVISQAVLRHTDQPEKFLQKMISFAKKGGIIICMEVNREFECDGLYIEGMDYAGLCKHEGLEKIWRREYDMQGRDYSIAMKLPHLMKKNGLVDIDVRMNDKVTVITPEMDDYGAYISDFMKMHVWDKRISKEEQKNMTAYFMNHGMDRKDAESYIGLQNEIADYMHKQKMNISLTCVNGCMVVFGRR